VTDISIIITSYNYDKYIVRAIDSAINQSFDSDKYEILVIDDCSSDRTADLAMNFGNKLTLVQNDTNIGLAASCNRAILLANGKYIIRLDADDYVHRDFLKIHHAFVSGNEYMDATSSDYLDVDSDENVLRRKCGATWPIACNTMYLLSDIISVGGYNEKLPREDFDFTYRFLRAGKHIYNIPVPLYFHTKHVESRSVNKL